MQSEILVSVIIPMYRAEKWIETAIKSIENQSWKNWELLLVDDGSPDRCGEIGREWAQKDKRIRVVYHETNKGISAARNTGIRESKGEYIAFLDADDYAETDYIEKMINIAQRSNVSLVCCNHIIARGRTKRPRFKVSEQEFKLEEETAYSGILYHGIPDVSVWGKLIRRDLFSTFQYPEGKLYEDTYCIAELIHAAGGLVFFSRPLYQYRVHDGSISHGRFDPGQMDFIDAVDHMTDEINRYFPEKFYEGIIRRKLHAYLSVRRLLTYDKGVHKREKKELNKRIFLEADRIHSFRCLTIQDRIAIYALRLGDNCFDVLWGIYERCR